MTTESKVFSQSEPKSPLLAAIDRMAISAGFLLVHIAGGVLAFVALKHALQFRLLLQVLWDRVIILGNFRPLWLLIPASLFLVMVLAGVLATQSIRRLLARQPEPDAFLRFRVLAYVAVGCVAFDAFVLSTPETFSGPFRVRFPVVADVVAGLAYGMYGIWALSLPRLRRVVALPVRRGLDIVCMNAVIILALTELSLRVLATFWTSPLLVTESSPSQIRRDSERLQPGALLFGFPINQGGHNDSEFLPRAGRKGKTVVSIGDSFSYGVVPHAFHFTTIAEREANGVEIYNMGYPGIGPIEYLHLLRHDALPLEPDLVLVQIFVGNDVADSPSLAGPTRWYDADSYLLAIVWYRLQIMRQAKRVNVTEGVAGVDARTAELTTAYPWLADPAREPASMGREVYVQLELRNASAISATIPGVYDRFFETLAAITYVAGETPVAFVLIPDEFQVEDDLWAELVRLSDVPLDRDRPQRLIGEWLRRVELPVLDLLPALRAVEPMKDGRRRVYHLQDTHFNARGNAVAGREIARFVDSLFAVPPESRRRAVLHASAPPPPPTALPRRIDFSDSTTRQWMSGWYPAEESGGRALAWSNGISSVLKVSLPTTDDIRMTFEALPYEFRRSPRQKVTVVLNGTVIEELQLRSGLQNYSVILPKAALRAAPHTLEFKYAYARKPADVAPGSPDIRELAVAWYSLAFALQRP